MSSHARQQQAVLVLGLLKVALSPWPQWNRRPWMLPSSVSSDSNIRLFFFMCYILYIFECMLFCGSFSVVFSLSPLVVTEWNKGLSLWPLIFHCLLFQQYCCWEHALIASNLFFYDKQNTFLAIQQLVCHQTCGRALREMLTSAVWNRVLTARLNVSLRLL